MNTELSQAAKRKPATGRILVADDTANALELLRFILEPIGYEVTEATDGEQLIAKALHCKPQLMIVDLQLPKLDGWVATAALRQIPAFEKTPIVALIAAASEVVPDQIARGGFTDHLVKPIGSARLRKCIASLL